MSSIEQSPALILPEERLGVVDHVTSEIEHDKANRSELYRILADTSPELLAAFEPDAWQLADLDLQNDKIAALLTKRAQLLGDLQQYCPSTDSELERAMENPAIYLREVLAGLYARCQDRVVTGRSMPGVDKNHFLTYFSTIRRSETADGAIHVQPELFMRITWEVDRYDAAATAAYRRLDVATNFRRQPGDQTSTYVFSVPHTADELHIYERCYRKGEYLEIPVEERFKQCRLLQALIVDMQSESERLSPNDDADAKRITQWYARNEVQFS